MNKWNIFNIWLYFGMLIEKILQTFICITLYVLWYNKLATFIIIIIFFLSNKSI